MRNGAIKDYRWHLWATRSGIAQGSPWAPTELVSTKPHTQHWRCSCKSSIGIRTSPTTAPSPQLYLTPGAKHQDGHCQKLAASASPSPWDSTHQAPARFRVHGLSAFCGRGCRHSTMQSLFLLSGKLRDFHSCSISTNLTCPPTAKSGTLLLHKPANFPPTHISRASIPFFSYCHPTIFVLTACTCTYIQSIHIKC